MIIEEFDTLLKFDMELIAGIILFISYNFNNNFNNLYFLPFIIILLKPVSTQVVIHTLVC